MLFRSVGEKKAGPAPRGMDLFAITLSPTGDVVIDTSMLSPHLRFGEISPRQIWHAARFAAAACASPRCTISQNSGVIMLPSK